MSKNIQSGFAFIICLMIGFDFCSQARASTRNSSESDKTSSSAKIKQLQNLLQEFREMRKQSDDYWSREMASDIKLWETNSGIWAMHAQDKAFDERCAEIEFRIRELEAQNQTKRRQSH